jgi:hypothetical protein
MVQLKMVGKTWRLPPIPTSPAVKRVKREMQKQGSSEFSRRFSNFGKI